VDCRRHRRHRLTTPPWPAQRAGLVGRGKITRWVIWNLHRNIAGAPLGTGLFARTVRFCRDAAGCMKQRSVDGSEPGPHSATQNHDMRPSFGRKHCTGCRHSPAEVRDCVDDSGVDFTAEYSAPIAGAAAVVSSRRSTRAVRLRSRPSSPALPLSGRSIVSSGAGFGPCGLPHADRRASWHHGQPERRWRPGPRRRGTTRPGGKAAATAA
jgi:hypothetical protein